MSKKMKVKRMRWQTADEEEEKVDARMGREPSGEEEA